MNNIDRLLLACAHLPHSDDTLLVQQFAAVTAWDDLLSTTEKQGLGPLLYAHGRHNAITLPDKIRLSLQGMYLRARYWYDAAAAVTEEVLLTAQSLNVPVVVLKGMVLASTVYPETALRPMRDVDLLMDPIDEPRLYQALTERGYTLLSGESIPPDHRHGLGLIRTVDGMAVHLELHHNLFSGFMAGDSLTLANTMGDLRPFRMGNLEGHTLDHDVMLWHLYRHMITEPWRLIRVVDLVAYAETYLHQIDWPRLQQRYPLAIRALALLHGITPLSAQLQDKVSIDPAFTLALTEIPRDWPPFGDEHWAEMAPWQVVKSLFFPQPASICLYYGIRQAKELAWQRWLRHPLQVWGWIFRRLLWQESRS